MKVSHALWATTLAISVLPADAFWRLVCSTVQVGRVDPIVNPGGIASHCHTIAGPANINTTSTYASLQAAYCTSCSIQKDKSAYWTPNLYYRYRNGSFQEITNDGTIVYYLDRGAEVANMIPFPPGFRMLSGNSNARAYDPNTLTYGGNASYGNRPISDRVTFACLDYTVSGPSAETNGFNRTSCSSGLRAQVHFQTCWDGINLWKADQSHVAYLSGIDNGVCPPTHPKLFPHLFIELYYNVNAVDQSDGGMFVFSNGDTTGYGFHGDFLNGWDTTVLSSAMKQCMGPQATNQGQIALCPVLQASVDPYYSQNCPLQPPLVNETARGLLQRLPGCNPPTGGPQAASNPACPVQPNVVPGVASSYDYVVRTAPNPGDKVGNWTYMGCSIDSANPRSLTGSSYSNQTANTIELCTAYCKTNGFIYAGMENGYQCYCGNNILSPFSGADVCNIKDYVVCSGNNFEYCGGPNIIQIWNDTMYSGPAIKPAPTADVTTLTFSGGTTALYAGCYLEGSNVRALTGSTYTNSTGMTLESCAAFCQSKSYKLFGTEYSQECYCGNTLTTNTVGQNNCSMACSGDKTELCGAGQRLSVWSLTGAIPSPVAGASASTTMIGASAPATLGPITGISYVGCYSETNPRALTQSLTSDPGMSIDLCGRGAQALNAKYFGLEYASQCLVGSVLNNNSAPLATSRCGMSCAGNPAQICGGPSAISLYLNTQYIAPPNPVVVTVPSSTAQYVYVGCYSEPGSNGGRAIGSSSISGSYSISNSAMTVESCAAVCFSKGYTWMGVEFGTECYCNSAGVVNGGTLSPGGNADCSMACAGNVTEYCGASSKVGVYQLKGS